MADFTPSLTLTPDEIDNSSLGMTPTMSSVVMTETKEYSAGAIDESMLTEEEKAQVAQFAQSIDLTDSRQVMQYGAAAQRNIASFSTSQLKKVRNFDLGEVGDSLKELTVALNATTEPQRKGLLGFFQKTKRTFESIKATYTTAENNVQRIEKDLRSHQVAMTQDVAMFDQMYGLNLKYYKELTMYIIAGKKALDNAKSTKLEELRAIAGSSNDQADIEAFQDYENKLNRFEKKLSDLEITRVIAMQQAPQIRLLQNADQELLEKIQSSLVNTIPLWRNQLVMTLGLEHSKRALEAQNAVSDMTNELLKKNAETLHQASVEIARESERPVVDMETLRISNRELIASLNEVMKAHEDGAKRRADAAGELAKIETELKEAMLEMANK